MFHFWLIAISLPPLIILAASHSSIKTEKLRDLAVVGAIVMLVICCFVFIFKGFKETNFSAFTFWGKYWGRHIFYIDDFSLVLIPLPSALWLLTVAVTPRIFLERKGISRTGLVTLTSTLFFMTRNPALLSMLWVLSVMFYLAALSSPESKGVKKTAFIYLGFSIVFLVSGFALLSFEDVNPGLKSTGIWLILMGALIREGVIPFHAWIPEAFEKGALGPILLFSSPLLGAYITVLFVVPLADPFVLRMVAILALVTAVYGAISMLYQRDARRSCGYLFVSQSALVIAGLDCASKESLAGSLILWISSSLAFAGISRCLLVLEARRGRQNLSIHYGGYDQMPNLAISFLVLGLACTGFPGTLGFVAEEFIMDGAVNAFPVLGFLVAVTGGLTGLGVLRMYFSLFCGVPDKGPKLETRSRERVVFSALAVFLIVFGLFPHLIVDSRFKASTLILEKRSAFYQNVDENP